jgi:hypothetical protein
MPRGLAPSRACRGVTVGRHLRFIWYETICCCFGGLSMRHRCHLRDRQSPCRFGTNVYGRAGAGGTPTQSACMGGTYSACPRHAVYGLLSGRRQLPVYAASTRRSGCRAQLIAEVHALEHERHRVQHALRERDHLYRLLVENSLGLYTGCKIWSGAYAAPVRGTAAADGAGPARRVAPSRCKRLPWAVPRRYPHARCRETRSAAACRTPPGAAQ